MLIVTLSAPEKTQLVEVEKVADIVELRSDLYDCSDLQSSKPLMVTGPYCPIETVYRDGGEGGEVKISSYHHYEETPEDLFALLKGKADIYKVATMANSTLDALRMLLFVREATAKGVRVVGHCMGDLGQVSRILGPVYGNVFTYACLDKPVAPGQLSAKVLLETYNYRSLNSQTAVYGLIGDPVCYSQGHVAHNQYFREEGINAVYVKMRVLPHELDQFFVYAKELGFKGLSVTMPLKERVLPPKVCNTLKFTAEGIEGYNTDGSATVKALEKRTKLKGKSVLLLGAGGYAKAAAAALAEAGAHITVFNRTKEKAHMLAEQVGGAAGTLCPHDILINATPVGMGTEELPIPEEALSGFSIVLDAIAGQTPLLKAAAKRGAICISGTEIFQLQAEEQRQNWLK